MRIGIIGVGKMGEMIAQGLKGSQYTIQASTRSRSSALEAAQRLSIECGTDNSKLTSTSDVILLCTKPHQAETVLKSIQPALDETKLLISICASISTEQIHQWGGELSPVIRAMPNTPCLIGEGMTVLSLGKNTQNAHLKMAEEIFGRLGKTVLLEESLMDGATGLSGCGPAYVYLIIEALSEAGVKVGLPRKAATLLAAQTLSGAAQMVLTRNIHPAAMKDEVTTPAGCTIDGLMALEEGKLRMTLIKAVLAATKRSQKLRRRTQVNEHGREKF